MVDFFTIIGISATAIFGFLTLMQARGNRFISSINIERVKWINHIRELFSQFDKNAFLQMKRYKELNENGKSTIDDMSNEIVYLNNHIELFLNPKEIVSVKLLEIQQGITNSLFNSSPNLGFKSGDLSEMLLDLHYLQQVILKAEWKRVKEENILGREVTEDEMNDMFMKTAEKISEEKYIKLLKKQFVEKEIEKFY